jgi:chemotaxis protein CheX
MMEQDLIKAFGESTKNVISSMAGIKLEHFKPESRDSLKCFVTGTLGLTGESNASIAISFSKDAIERIHRGVFAGEQTEISFSSIGDLVGEITNMVWGYARKILTERGLDIDASIPTVVLGDRQHLHNPSGTVRKIIPFTFEGLTMFVEITTRK